MNQRMSCGQGGLLLLAAMALVASPIALARQLKDAAATSCPPMTGYVAVINMDHDGDNLQPEWVSYPDAACNKDPNCKGFNLRSDGRGQLKSSTAPGNPSDGMCLYTKKATPCPSKPGFSRLVDYDHAYDDITSWLDDPASYCSTDTSCQGFNLRLNGTGQPKRSTLQGAFYSHNFCLYTKSEVACPAKPGYNVLVDVAHNGDDISDVVADPLSLCNADPACTGFSLGSLSGQGQAKSNTTINYGSPGSCLYVKKLTACPGQPGYSRVIDYGHDGDDLVEGPTSDPVTACNGDGGCAGYIVRPDGTWVTKAATTEDAVYSHGLCMYTKSAVACPPKTGYRVIVDTDHYQDDLSTSELNDPLGSCNKDPACKGFTMSSLTGTGMTKSNTTLTFAKPGVCLYTKSGTSCPSKSNYSRVIDYDHAYDDLQPNTWISNPDEACSQRDDCVGFNVGLDQKGMIKTSTLKDAFYSYGYCLYTKTAVACPPQDGYSLRWDADHPWDSLSSGVVASPAAACNLDPACKGFTTSSTDTSNGRNQGVTLSNTTPPVASPGTCLYTKK